MPSKDKRNEGSIPFTRSPPSHRKYVVFLQSYASWREFLHEYAHAHGELNWTNSKLRRLDTSTRRGARVLVLIATSLGEVASRLHVEVSRTYVGNGSWGRADKACITVQCHRK